jgi:hypothetical protein
MTEPMNQYQAVLEAARQVYQTQGELRAQERDAAQQRRFDAMVKDLPANERAEMARPAQS